MTSTSPAKEEILSLHGIRFIVSIMLLLSHKSLMLNLKPITNRLEMNTFFTEPISIICRACYLYTDIFLMLSGLLVAYSLIGRMQRGKKINILKEITGRYFRFMPPMAALIIFATFVLPHLGSGPLWNMLITSQSKICKKTWWKSFLMIHNWFGFGTICITNTHHVGIDFELFVIALFFIVLLRFHELAGIVTIIVLATLSTIARFYVVFDRELIVYITYDKT